MPNNNSFIYENVDELKAKTLLHTSVDSVYQPCCRLTSVCLNRAKALIFDYYAKGLKTLLEEDHEDPFNFGDLPQCFYSRKRLFCAYQHINLCFKKRSKTL